MVSQSVLLRGVNDDADTLEALMRAFVEARVKPYYLHHADLAPGTAHLRTTIAEGQALMRELRRRLSGLALPTYVLDIPGARGKVPIGPNYVERERGWLSARRSARRTGSPIATSTMRPAELGQAGAGGLSCPRSPICLVSPSSRSAWC